MKKVSLLLLVSILFFVLLIANLAWNSRFTGESIQEALFAHPISLLVMVWLVILGMGIGEQIDLIKKQRKG